MREVRLILARFERRTELPLCDLPLSLYPANFVFGDWAFRMARPPNVVEAHRYGTARDYSHGRDRESWVFAYRLHRRRSCSRL